MRGIQYPQKRDIEGDIYQELFEIKEINARKVVKDEAERGDATW